MLKTAPGVLLLQGAGLCPPHPRTRETLFRWGKYFLPSLEIFSPNLLLSRVSVLVLTFMAYTSYHLSRKPISIVKNSPAFLNCPDNSTCT